MEHFTLNVCENADDAIARGFNWSAQPDVQDGEIERLVVVRDGTVSHNATVDIVIRLPDGKRIVAMTTAALLNAAVAGFAPL